MSEAKILRVYLDETMLDMARNGHFGFVSRVQNAFGGIGFDVQLVENSFDERMKSGALDGYSLFHMDDPFHKKSLTMRKSYYFPFWRIEATAKRWEFEVADKIFDPGELDLDEAQRWMRSWRKWLFKNHHERIEFQDFIYVALQGKLLTKRSFQMMSPMDMIAEVQSRAGDRKILLGLHPGEHYSDEEREALSEIVETDPRVTLQTGGMEEALRTCQLVVSQNSAAALSAMFYRKPSILFAQSDFHHQCFNVDVLGVDEAFRMAGEVIPRFAAYLYWFVQLNSIKADEDGTAEAQILDACRARGWEI